MDASDSWFDTSCPGYVESVDAEGDQLLNWKGKGYRTVLDLLMVCSIYVFIFDGYIIRLFYIGQKKIPDPSAALDIDSKIHLNKRVKNVRWANAAKTVVECEDGHCYEADHVICTVSVGVLNAHHSTLFSPELPIPKRNAIEGLKLGTVNKIYIEFEQAFWPENWDGFVCLWRDADLAEVRADPDEQWAEGIGSISTVQYHRNLLCCWTAGPLSREMETKSAAVVQQVAMKWLRRFLSKHVIPEPINIIR